MHVCGMREDDSYVAGNAGPFHNRALGTPERVGAKFGSLVWLSLIFVHGHPTRSPRHKRRNKSLPGRHCKECIGIHSWTLLEQRAKHFGLSDDPI